MKVIKETKPTSSDIFFSMFNEDSEAFESSVLAAAIVLVKKNKHFLNTICSLKPTGGYHWDFLSGARNVALISYRNYRDLMEASGTSVTGRIPAWKVMFHFCSTLLETHPDLGSVADLPKIEAEWAKLSTVTKDQIEAVKTPGVLKDWLSSVRVNKELTSAAHNGEVKRNPGALINRLTKKVADIQLEESEVVQTVFDFGEIATYDPDTAEKISSGLPQLDKAIGGGYAKSNSYCFVAYTGTGKTTFGVQMAATFCNLQGLKGIFVTTEETPMQIKLRMIAHCCNIDWGYLMANSATFEPTSLDPKKYAMYKKMMDNMSNSFRVVDWSVAGNINQDIEEVVEQFIADKGCPPDFLIFDWLGGALDNLSTAGGSNEGDRLRHVYNSAAERLRQIGKKYRPVVIYMMQAKANALNRSRVGQDMIGESFGPSKGVSAVIGMSAVQEEGGDEAGSKNTYAERQTLFVGKSRHGPGGAVPFRRNFAVQRLEPIV